MGADRAPEARPPQPFGASVPLRKALGDEVLLAWEMNGAPLPAAHGAPLRLVVPGWIGARSVKWLRRIELRDRPFDGWFQDVAYRLLAPGQEPGPGVGIALGEVALNADVLVPADGATVGPGPFEVRGYAHAGGDRTVARVDVSADGGRSWRQAELLEDLGRWAWRLWRAELALPPGEHELVVRAWDSAAATQPESPAAVWNPKGYVNNAWGRITRAGGAMSDGRAARRAAAAGRTTRARPLDPRDYSRRTLLANERTFLAWWRTGLAALTVGLACARIIPIVGQVQAQWPYTVIGVLFAALGVVCLVYGEQRRRAVDEAVRRGGLRRARRPGACSCSRCSPRWPGSAWSWSSSSTPEGDR